MIRGTDNASGRPKTSTSSAAGPKKVPSSRFEGRPQTSSADIGQKDVKNQINSPRGVRLKPVFKKRRSNAVEHCGSFGSDERGK